jgi:hypothetical protein
MGDSFQRISDALAAVVEHIGNHRSAITRAITTFNKDRVTNDPCAAFRWVKIHQDVLAKEFPALLEATRELEHLCKDSLLKLEASLRDASAAEGWSLLGQWPNYYVDHFLPIAIDERELSITVGRKKLPNLDLNNVIPSIRAELKQFKPDHKALAAFRQALFESYSRLATQGIPTVSVWAVYRDMVLYRQSRKLWKDATAATFRPFPELEFRALMTELLKANLTSISGKQLRLLPPITKDESMYIYQPIENRFCHVGRIQFTESKEGGLFD